MNSVCVEYTHRIFSVFANHHYVSLRTRITKLSECGSSADFKSFHQSKSIALIKVYSLLLRWDKANENARNFQASEIDVSQFNQPTSCHCETKQNFCIV